jgi:hypothetical protein
MSEHTPACVILNRNYPPDPGVTGHAAAELARFMTESGIRVTAASVAGRYAGGVSGGDGGADVERIRVPAIYDGKRALPRLIASLIEGRALARLIRSGVVIGMTDPPLLNWWVSRRCASLKLPWICWSMDLYPEAFVSAGLVSDTNPVYRKLRDDLRKHPPDLLIALGEGQADHLREDLGWDVPRIILPCGIHDEARSSAPPAWHSGDERIVFAYLGNIGQAHDPEFVVEVMRALDPARHLMLLAPYGVHAGRLLDEAARHPAVRIVGNVPRNELGWIDVHLATLDPSWDHVCVPSKSVSAVCAGSALLLCASDRNDNWLLLNDACWRIDPHGDLAAAVRAWLAAFTPEALASRKKRATEIARDLIAMRDRAFVDIRDVIRRLFICSH